MKRYLYLNALVSAILMFTACSETDDPTTIGGGTEWAIPASNVISVLPADNIPALTNPEFVSIDQIDYMEEDDLIIGVKVGDEVRGYPHPILDWHEIVNDDVGGLKIAVTYCPLTGTAIGWNRVVDGQETTFGVSGNLYNTNLMPYDRSTGTIWSQMLLEAVNGNLINTRIETLPLVETSWASWKAMYPNSKIVSSNTGFPRNYTVYPYGNYKTSTSFLFPIDNLDERVFPKARVMGVERNGNAKVYRFASITESGDMRVKFDTFEDLDLVLAASNNENIFVVYQRELADGTRPNFVPIPNALPIIMGDEEGNEWNIFGEAVSGPRTGEKLETVESYIGMFFAWGTFHPQMELFEE